MTDHNTFVYAGFAEGALKALEGIRHELYKVLGKKAPHWHLHVTLTANIFPGTHYSNLADLEDVVRAVVGTKSAATLIPSKELQANGGAWITFENQVVPFDRINRDVQDRLGNEYTTDGWHASVMYDEEITGTQTKLLRETYRRMRPDSLRCNHYGDFYAAMSQAGSLYGQMGAVSSLPSRRCCTHRPRWQGSGWRHRMGKKRVPKRRAWGPFFVIAVGDAGIESAASCMSSRHCCQ